VLAAATASARTHVVIANPDLTFTPTHLTIWQGDVVNFRNGGGVHNVVADNLYFKCSVNCNTNSTPSALAWSAIVQFRRLGTFGYFCEQHGDTMIGMRGSITVIDRVFVDGFDEPAP
jgi:plastocyanin